MALKIREIVEGIYPAQLAGVGQAHENVADICSVACFIEQGVLTV
jgi:hypothetical protein